jgi:hypothetical protein
MRILHELQMGGKVLRTSPDKRAQWDAVGAPPVQAAVTLDNLASWLWASPKLLWSLDDDFGPLRPPFDNMWMEWEYPKPEHVNPNALREPFPVGSSGASWITCQDDHNFSVRDFARLRGWGIIPSPWMTYIKLDDDGRNPVVNVGFEWAEDADTFEDKVESLTPLEALLGISLMNCRNVTLSDERPAKQTTMRAKRAASTPYAMKQINVPGLNRATTRAQSRNAAGSAIPLHLVRGHFKTFTEERPLFGSKTGTYWWGWQARGDAKHGVRDHEYVVGPPS